MNRTEAGRVVAVIIAACPAQSTRLDRDRITSMIDTFAQLLDDVTYEQANAALRVLLQTKTWMPSIADVRATVLEISRGPVRAGGEAWGSVMRAIGKYGAYRTPGRDFVFDDPVTVRAVEALSWQELCLSENTIADRARFIELYDRLATREHRERAAPLLVAARDCRERGVSLPNLIQRVLLKGNEP